MRLRQMSADLVPLCCICLSAVVRDVGVSVLCLDGYRLGSPDRKSDQGPISIAVQTRQCLSVRKRTGGSIRTRGVAIVASQNKRMVILVEDDLSVLRALRRLMVGAGFEVRAFDRPCEVLGTEIPDCDACLLVDIHLPEMTGVELCERLAASGCRLPAIMITADLDSATRRLASQADPVAVLYKPFSRDALLKALSEAFAR